MDKDRDKDKSKRKHLAAGQGATNRAAVRFKKTHAIIGAHYGVSPSFC